MTNLRQPFSSLLSKQSGSPLHCRPPGTHLPSPHMKIPGMLQSVVKLFPGSSWLSVDKQEKQRRGQTITNSLCKEIKQVERLHYSDTHHQSQNGNLLLSPLSKDRKILKAAALFKKPYQSMSK